MLEQAITATNSLDHKVLADYMRSNELQTIVGPVRFGKDGEWATPRIVMIQFRGIAAAISNNFASRANRLSSSRTNSRPAS